MKRCIPAEPGFKAIAILGDRSGSSFEAVEVPIVAWVVDPDLDHNDDEHWAEPVLPHTCGYDGVLFPTGEVSEPFGRLWKSRDEFVKEMIRRKYIQATW